MDEDHRVSLDNSTCPRKTTCSCWSSRRPTPHAATRVDEDSFVDFGELLSRDQRTVLTANKNDRLTEKRNRRTLAAETGSSNSVVLNSRRVSGGEIQCKKSVCSSLAKKNISSALHHISRNLSRLGKILFWGICTLTVVRITGVSSAPTSAPNLGPEKWIHPCGESALKEYTDSELVDFVTGGSNGDLVNQILLTAKNTRDLAYHFKDDYVSPQNQTTRIVIQAEHALEKSKSFRDYYVKATFKKNFKEHHESFLGFHYNWLPSGIDVPKNLGETLSTEYLNSLNFGESLRKSYEILQKYAVGLEQIVVDKQAVENKTLLFENDFSESGNKLRQTLCEIQVAMLELNITQKPDVSRSIMPNEYRNMSETGGMIRDWIIFRDYMNGLEYVIQVFEHFRTKFS